MSASLLENSILARYQSHDFPAITFKPNNNGNIFIVNGHHRIAAWKSVHQELVDRLHYYERLLKRQFSVASDNDTPEIIEAHNHVDELKERLLKEGGWDAVVLDFGMFNSNIHQFAE